MGRELGAATERPVNGGPRLIGLGVAWSHLVPSGEDLTGW